MQATIAQIAALEKRARDAGDRETARLCFIALAIPGDKWARIERDAARERIARLLAAE